jgi:hypothetical protein
MPAENAAAFPQPKPTIAEILIEGATTDQPEMDMMMRIAEHHPKATRAEFEAATAAAMAALTGRQEAPRPTAPVYWIVRQKLDAVETCGDSETQEIRSWVKDAAGIINQHPAHLNIFWWLAMEGLENMFSSAAMERSIDYAIGIGSPEVEATQEDLDYLPPED